MKLNKHVKLFLKILSITVIVSAAVALLIFLAAVFGIIDTTADLDLDNLKLNFTSTIYYNDEITAKPVEYERLHAEENRTWVELTKVPMKLQDAIIAIEDERFYQHNGVDVMSTAKAVFDYFFSNDGRGASTITQQLVKNLTGDDKVDISRKATEIIRALNLERKLSKQQILELYLNTIYLGNGCYGVSTATNLYMNKDVGELTLAEAALIAGITQYPSRYDPIYKFQESKLKQELVLEKMLSLGYISQQEYDAAVAEKLEIHSKKKDDAGSKQSYFVDQIINDVYNDLVTKNGYTEAMANKLIYNGGLKIYSTVDPNIQSIMNSTFSDMSNFPKVNKSPMPQSAMIIIDPLTGAIKGISGGCGPKEGDRVLNRATQALRQPGSTIKPLGVYAPALEKNLITPNSIYQDMPIKYGNWAPKNYYDSFRGSMTVRKALEQSVNTIAVQILDMVGVDYSYNFLTKNLGIESLVDNEKRADGKVYSDRYLSSLALGGLTDGITLRELAGAYAAFANRGIYTNPYTYTQVLDHSGKIILSNEKKTTIAMTEQTALVMNNLLKSVVTDGTGTAANFRDDLDICGKTGTTDNDVDRWFVGYTPYYVGVVWYGFDQPKTIDFVANNPAIPVWKKVMSSIHKGLPGSRFKKPDGVSGQAPAPKNYCMDSNQKPTTACYNEPRGSRVRTGTPPNGVAPTSYCTYHRQIKLDQVSQALATSNCPKDDVITASIVESSVSGGQVTINGTKYSYSSCPLHPATSSSSTPTPSSSSDPTTSPTPTGSKPSATPGKEDKPPDGTGRPGTPDESNNSEE